MFHLFLFFHPHMSPPLFWPRKYVKASSDGEFAQCQLVGGQCLTASRCSAQDSFLGPMGQKCQNGEVKSADVEEIMWDVCQKNWDFLQTSRFDRFMWAMMISMTQVKWKLAMKVGSKTDKLGFSSPLWTNTDVLNEASPMQEEVDAKYAEYLSVPFKEIRMCVGSPTSNCVTHQFSKTYDNAKALFSAGYIRDTSVKRDEILKAFGPTPGSYQECPMQRCQP